MSTVYITDVRYADHTLQGHPENANRLHAIWEYLEACDILTDLETLEPVEVEESQIEAVHTRRYLDVLAAERDKLVFLDADTYVLPDSYAIARLAAGGVIRAVEAVVGDEADNGVAVVRPPGHHATPERGMGFCLLNNIAIAARHALKGLALERVAIVDYDVHHGNGTQDTFYADPDVLFLSTHQSPLYPGTGAQSEMGRGAGKGSTINIPLPAGVGDEGYRAVYDEIVWPAIRRFDPALILVSAGFDAHWADPLAMMNLTLAGYAHLSRELVEMAGELCEGRIVFVLEGGYSPEALSNGILNVCYALLGRDDIVDPLDNADPLEPPIDALLTSVKQRHDLD